MPVYEYLCGSCGRRTDVIHGIHVPGPTACEACGGPLRKAVSAAAIVFKGAGWAKKDARDRQVRPSADKASEKAGESSASDGDRTTDTRADGETKAQIGASDAPAKTTPASERKESPAAASKKTGD